MTAADPVVARNIRNLRQAARLERRELATAAGISLSFLEKLELAYLRPSARTIRALARALGVSVRYLHQELEAPPSRPQDALAKVVRTAREAAGQSREELADKAGLRPSYLGDIETGRRVPPRPTLNALARAMGVPQAKLVAAALEWRPQIVADRLRDLRLAAGLRQWKVASMAGISPYYLGAIERGLVAIPSAETIAALAKALLVAPAELVKQLDGPVRPRPRQRAAEGPRRVRNGRQGARSSR